MVMMVVADAPNAGMTAEVAVARVDQAAVVVAETVAVVAARIAEVVVAVVIVVAPETNLTTRIK